MLRSGLAAAWMLAGLSLNASGPDLNKATYRGLEPDAFMKRWLVTRPIPVFPDTSGERGQEAQKARFDSEFADPRQIGAALADGFIRAGAHKSGWRAVESETPLVDLGRLSGEKTFAAAYALARIEMPRDTTVLFGVGSDDAVRMWLNGEKVFENWVGRAPSADDDLVALRLKKGPNDLLLKIQNMEYGWGFLCRPLGASRLPEILVLNAASGDLDDLGTLLENGADPNPRFGPGATPFQAARIKGRREAQALLVRHGADTTLAMPPPEAVADYLFTRAIRPGYPGASVLAARDGRILYEKGFGLADVRSGQAITPETTFRIGSITKQFTAAALLKLQEEGRLSMRDPLSKYFPGFPRGDDVTLRHLLNHTSGIRSFTEVPGFQEKVTRPVTSEWMVEAIRSYGYDFDPGSRWQYNNSAYFLAGVIVEKASGKPFGAFLKENFFDPLGMTSTGVYEKGLGLPREAVGYAYGAEGVKPAPDWDMSWAGGAGNLYSTVRDLFLWNEALWSGRVLKPESMAAAWTPATLNDGRPAEAQGARYGYGWSLSAYRGLELAAHGGGLDGFNAYLLRNPREKWTVAVLSNCLPNVPNLNPYALATDLTDLYLWETLAPQASYGTVRLEAGSLDDFTGRYDYGAAGVMEVVREGDALFAQLTSQPRFQIFPKSADEFFWKVVEASVAFVRGADGAVTHGVHRQGGAVLKAAKLPDLPDTPVAPAILAAYAGVYELNPGFTITVSLEKERLSLQATGQPKLSLYAASDAEFQVREANARILFAKDASGRVTHLTLDQAGMKQEARRRD
jgi:CubicO group peptidase (beta-lactamase class C family)